MNKSLPELIRELRDTTQAPMMDCKKALEENGHDLEKATQWLREKGLAKAAKKLTSVASDGQTRVVVSGNRAVVYEVNCQTDFTALNDGFTKLCDQIGQALLKHAKPGEQDASQYLTPGNETIEQACLHLTAKIGEKIVLRRHHLFEKTDHDTFGAYIHMNGKIASLVVLAGSKDAETAKGLAMHLAAMNPKFMDQTKVDQEWLANEKKILMEQTLAEGKPKDFAERIVSGRIGKLLAESCFADQPYVKEPTKKVSQIASDAGGKITFMLRYELGEGIDKQQTNFAQEVADQMKQAKGS